MQEILEEIARRQPCYVELRYHEHVTSSLMAQKGRIDQAGTSRHQGVGVRALVNGSWGFSSTSNLERGAIESAIGRAVEAARELARSQKKKIPEFSPMALSRADYEEPGYKELRAISIEDKIARVVETEQKLLKESALIHTAVVRYNEIFEHKAIATSDGAACSRRLVRPEFRTAAFTGSGSEQQVAGRGVGVTGGWQCLFHHPSAANMVGETAREAVELLKAGHPEGGVKTVILEPALVGLLCHEAVGHTVEADFVQSGSVAKGRLGTRVASDLVTLCDSGIPPYSGGPGGYLPFDDEGVPCRTTTIIENGTLKSYLHNRESAAIMGAEPRGNARAWNYADEPIIRMTNTYMLPGTMALEDIIASTADGLLVTGAGGGQADASGEFMFSASSAFEIKQGKLGRRLREVTLSGVAFDVLQTVDAVSREFRWDMGSGYCGKGQPAKVDAGGPYIRCRLMVGGRQEG